MFTLAVPLLLTVDVAVSVTCRVLFKVPVIVAGAAYVTEVGVTLVSVPHALPVQDVPVSGVSVHLTPVVVVALFSATNTVKLMVWPTSIVCRVPGFGTTTT